jgi:transposase
MNGSHCQDMTPDPTADPDGCGCKGCLAREFLDFFRQFLCLLSKTVHSFSRLSICLLTVAAEQNRPDIQLARRKWQSEQPAWEAARLVFLDETGLNTKMTRLYGRAERAMRCHCPVPHGHWSTATFIAALRHDRVTAPLLLDGPMDGAMFLAYVQKILAPELRRGDRVICDNLSSHKVSGVRQTIEDCGAELLYLPPYSPDLNPIELAFSKLKAFLRARAQRTFPGLVRATAHALDSFSAAHCLHFFHHAKYAPN